ncbi:MAG: hypothetical protein WCF36_12905 [Candidatus Nanopelagicales bacterium]
MTINRFTAGIPVQRARAGLDAVRAEFGVAAEFPMQVHDETRRAIDAYRLPDVDLTELGFVTLDPASSTDLDQAFLSNRPGRDSGSGMRSPTCRHSWRSVVPSMRTPAGAGRPCTART